MNGSRLKQKDWTLTQEAFDRFLFWLDPDRALAGEKYERIRSKLMVFFAARRCGDADGLVDETINRAARRILEMGELPDKPEAYCKGVAVKVAFEFSRHPELTKKTSLDNLTLEKLPTVSPTQNPLEFSVWEEEKYDECFKRCWQKMLQPDRDMVVKYYESEEGEGELKRKRTALAAGLGITVKELCAKVLRRRKKLKECVDECLRTRRSE